MGYWEQIGEENRKQRENRAAMHPLQRKIYSSLAMAFIIIVNIMLWAIMLAPFWMPFTRPA